MRKVLITLTSFALVFLVFTGCSKKAETKKDAVLIEQEQSKKTSEASLVVVPDLTGLSYEKACLKLQELKLIPQLATALEEGKVVDQLPYRGDKTVRGGIVWLWLEKENKKTTSAQSLKSSQKKQFTVCLDPGHQAQADLKPEPIGPNASQTKERCRGGTRGVKTKTPEYQLTLTIALKLRNELEKSGIKVVMTRESNQVKVSNAERAQIANQAQADLFLRLHFDGSSNSQTRGASFLVPAKNQWTKPIYQESYQAAQVIKKAYIEATGLKDLGIILRDDITGFNWSKVPVVLAEMGFLTSPEEDTLLNNPSFQQKMVTGLKKGITHYLKAKKD